MDPFFQKQKVNYKKNAKKLGTKNKNNALHFSLNQQKDILGQFCKKYMLDMLTWETSKIKLVKMN